MNIIETPGDFSHNGKKLCLSNSNRLELINIQEIIRCEAQNNYTLFFLTNKQKLISSKPLAEYEKILTPYQFIRVHQSHLINFQFIRSYIKGEQCQIMMDDHSLVDVSRRKKAEILQLLNALTE
jgi:two-component system, LytTR family, response regulator